MAAMFTQNIQKMVAHAANAYFEEEDIEMILKVKEEKHSKWERISFNMFSPTNDRGYDLRDHDHHGYHGQKHLF